MDDIDVYIDVYIDNDCTNFLIDGRNDIDPELIDYIDLDALSKIHTNGCLQCIDKSDAKCYTCPNYIYS